jgi:Family of unknown function (DUF6183)
MRACPFWLVFFHGAGVQNHRIVGMSNSVQDFLKSLPGASSFEASWHDAIESMGFEQLLEVYRGLERGDSDPADSSRNTLGISFWMLASVKYTLIPRSLALRFGTPGALEIARILIELQALGENQTTEKTMAMLLAFGNPSPLLEPVFAQYASDHRLTFFLEHLVQELVLQDSNFSLLPAMEAFWQARVRAGAPLTWLELRRSPLESHCLAYDQFYVNDIEKLDRPHWPHSPSEFLTQPMTFKPGDCDSDFDSDFHSGFDHERVRRAIDSWEINTHEYRIRDLSDATHVQAGVPALEVAVSLAWNAIEIDVFKRKVQTARASVVSVQEALESLYTTAYYNPWRLSGGGADARLMAWQSLAAMLGLAANASFETVESAAPAAVWIDLDLESDWFYDDENASKLSLACVTDRGVVCLLASTTT